MAILNPDNNENKETGEQKLSGQVYPKGVKPELSPNPKFSGFTKQVKCLFGKDDLSVHDFIDLNDTTYYDANKHDWLRIEPNTLFVLEYPNGDKEYWTVVDPNLSQVEGEDATSETPDENLIRVYPEYPSADAREPGKTPTPVLVKGSNEPNLKENQEPRKRPRVFSEPVAFQDDVYYKGQLLGEGGGSSSNTKYVHNIIFFDQYNRKSYAIMPIIDEDPNRVDSYYKLFTKLIQLGATSINDAFPIAGVDFSGAEFLPGIYAIMGQNNIGVINDGVLNISDGQVLSTIKDLVYAI